ncbi:MAG: class I SAM-dependent methyltransferase [Bacteroidetes bacterium]|nr:class I SAM-dependent methyltransferase [Bacteroidota bacterium]
MASVFKKFISTRTPKFYFMNKAVGNKSFTLLDIGAGNHSPSKTTTLFPGCSYYGLDLNKDYFYSPEDEKALKGFYEMDLTKLEFDVIPDNFFDYINMAHIIEHLHNGDEVIKRMSAKLKQGGHIYIEYPGKQSTKLPSMYGTLNFHDDTTHVRIYNYRELSNFLEQNGFQVLSSGMRRSWFYITLIPFRILSFWGRGKRLHANIFWDLLGFAEYVYAVKK